MKKYEIPDSNPESFMVNEEAVSLIYATRQGLSFDYFDKILSYIPLKIAEWSKYLNLSERTMQRYKKEHKHFDSIYAEKILEITLLYQNGEEVFGSSELFNQWMNIENTALGGVKPKSLLDSTFGINLIKDELTRLEQGVVS
jgi:putative toxin-antitoxin system antitoxin component (TIGR02293 family)